MKKIFTLILFTTIFVNAANSIDNDTTGISKIKDASKQISKILELDLYKTQQIYNVIKHFNQRVSDLELGTENYDRFIGYIAQEREDMMRSALSIAEYKIYSQHYKEKNEKEIESYIIKNKAHAPKKDNHTQIAQRESGNYISAF